MGYNGGVNKRGYYRREHGMYSKSSMNFGLKFMSNFFTGGIKIFSALVQDLMDLFNGISSVGPQSSDYYIKNPDSIKSDGKLTVDNPIIEEKLPMINNSVNKIPIATPDDESLLIDSSNNLSESSDDKHLSEQESSNQQSEDNYEETITLTVNHNILRIISTDYKLEAFYYFSQKLMSEDSFSKQQFSTHFRQNWFLYEEYKKSWIDFHHKLMFYAKCNQLAEEIMHDNLITLDDFKDKEGYKAYVNDLINNRLAKRELDYYEELKKAQTIPHYCIVFDYYNCRSKKIAYDSDQECVNNHLLFCYAECVSSVLHCYSLDTYKFSKLLEELKHTEANNATILQNNIINDDILDVVELQPINGEYVEPFKQPYGKLHIDKLYARISFYFPGPDARYRGTTFTISEDEIDKYIHAYQNNWDLGIKLKQKAKETPNSDIKHVGDMKMVIVANDTSFRIYLFQHFLPICNKKELEEMIMLLRHAKLRIEEIRNKLF